MVSLPESPTSRDRWIPIARRVRDLVESGPARVAGTVIGVATFGLLCSNFAHSLHRGTASLTLLRPRAILLSAAGFAVFHASAILALALLGGIKSARLWVAAQLAKYLPAPGASFAAMVRSSILGGATAGRAFALTTRHAALILSGALVAGSPAAGWLAAHRGHLPQWPTIVLVAGAGIVLMVVSTARLETAHKVRASAAAFVAWAGLGIALGVAFGSGGGVLAIAYAFPAAWAIGFIALPIPAGVGVREAMLVVLLTPWLGRDGALGFAILTRLLQTASDGLLAVGVLGLHPLSASVRQRSSQRD